MDAAMTEERDVFERQLERKMAPRSAPADLQRRIARIPLEHPRDARHAPFWRRWLDGVSAPWAASMTAAFASLAIGFWLGSSGVAETTDIASASMDEELVSLVFPSVPTTIGDLQ
jgi:hypothetical protein